MNSSPGEPGEGDDAVRLNEMVCFNLHAASRAMTAVYRPLLEPLGLTYPQYLVMATLWEYGDLPVGELVARLQLDYGTMTPLLKRLEKRKLLLRARNPDDERTVIVSLTPEGGAMREHAPGIYQAICDIFGFTPDRARAALDLLQSIVARADRAPGSPGSPTAS